MLNDVYRVTSGDHDPIKDGRWTYTRDAAHHADVSAQEASEIAAGKFREGHLFVMVVEAGYQALMADKAGIVNYLANPYDKIGLHLIEDTLKTEWQARYQAFLAVREIQS